MRQKGLKKLNPILVPNKAEQDNFEQTRENFEEIEERMDRQRYAFTPIGSGSFASTAYNYNYVKIDNMNVGLECTGKKPVRVCLQPRTRLFPGTVSAGGIYLDLSTPGVDNRLVLLLANVTKNQYVWATSIGETHTFPNYDEARVLYYPPSVVDYFERKPDEGYNEYELRGAFSSSVILANSWGVVNCELIAHELF